MEELGGGPLTKRPKRGLICPLCPLNVEVGFDSVSHERNANPKLTDSVNKQQHAGTDREDGWG